MGEKVVFLDTLARNLNRSIFRNEAALNYLQSRNVDDNDIRKYLIGYARVLSVSDDGSSEYKRFISETNLGRKFEKMLVFPIQSINGSVVGLIGRSLDVKNFRLFVTEEARFTGILFGLFQALPYIYKTHCVFVVEGSFDCIVFAKVFPNVVSSLTAGLSLKQYRMLNFFSEFIITVFDSDKAGQEAAEKVARKENVINLRLAYKDPAACMESLGFEKFQTYLRKRVKAVFPVWLSKYLQSFEEET